MQNGFTHEALPYEGQGAFVSTCVDVVTEALEHDARPIVLATSAKVDAVGSALGDAAGHVTLVATDEHGRNPSRITTMLHSFQAAGDGRPCLGVNESVVAGRTRAGLLELQLSEFLLNDPSLQSWPVSMVCLYDRTALDDDSLGWVRQSHPVVRGLDANPDYLPDRGLAFYAEDLEAPPDDAAALTVRRADLVAMRKFVRGASAEHGLPAERVDDLVLAANEVVTNSLRHGGKVASMAMWVADGSVVCEVRDRGHITDPLVGRLAPSPSATSGRGLWLAHHLCDLVQLRSSAAGTIVRLHLDR